MSTVSFPEYGPESPTREKSSRSRRSRLHSTFGTIKDYMTPRQVTMAAHAARSSTYVHSGDTVRAFFAAIDTKESDSVPVEMLRAALEQRGMSAAALEAFFDACPRQADDAMTLDEFLVGKRLPGMVELFSSVSMLPPGWSEVLEAGPGGRVYYWNRYTDQTTWIEPTMPAEQLVDMAKEIFERCPKHDAAVEYSKSQRDLLKHVSRDPSPIATSISDEDDDAASDAASVVTEADALISMRSPSPAVSWRSKREPSWRLSAHRHAPRVVTWPPLPPGSEIGLRGAGSKVKKLAMVRNAVLDRAGQPTEPPPPPISVAARIRALEKSHDPELDDTMWQWRQRKWVHLPPPSKKPTRESFTMRSRRTPYAVSANTLGPGGLALPRLLGAESPPLQKSPPKPSSPLTAVEKRETPQKLKMPPPPPTQSPSELKVAPGRLSRGASALSALTISTLNTLDEVRIISSFDKLMDKDHNGGLDFEELKAVLRSLNSALTNDELHAIFRECDPNGDGIVTISEFFRVRRGGLNKTNPSFAAPPGADPEAPPAPPASPPKPILSDEQVHSIKQWTPYAAGAAALIALVIIIGSSVTSYAAAGRASLTPRPTLLTLRPRSPSSRTSKNKKKH